ncbi:hypothetical protein Golomagni_02804 [Golovinomyces magnicellulatus]|nr:hypothetical protein Golomagni_02804 [Golovinomyces magnicellulatus]
METSSITGLERLEDHLTAILKDSETYLDENLIDKVQLQLTAGEVLPIVAPKLLPLLTKILPSYPHNPKYLIELSTKLLRPIKFMEILNFVSVEDLLTALESPFPSAVLLGISVISKASWAPSHTAILSTLKPIVHAFIRTWLSSPDVEVGEAATRTLGDLLEMDCECRKELSPDLLSRIGNPYTSIDVPSGQGLLWRRIFQDQDIYILLYSLCTLNIEEPEKDHQDKRQKSLAQGRLLRLLPRLATLNFQIITCSQCPAVEQSRGIRPEGILSFAATEMVNKKDLLMHITLIIFFGELLSLMSKLTLSPSTLNFLGALVERVASEDISLKESLKATTSASETSPELLDLLSKLAVV